MPKLNATTWRWIILCMCVIASMLAVADWFGAIGMGGAPPWTGKIAVSQGPPYYPFSQTVRSVGQDGPGERAGIRPGDLVELRPLTFQERVLTLSRLPFLGRPDRVVIRRGSVQQAFSVMPTAIPRSGWPTFALQELTAIWLAVFAALIAWRRSGVAEMRLLALLLGTYAITSLYAEGGGMTTPWPWFGAITAAVGDLNPLKVALWVALVGFFAPALSRIGRVAQWIAYLSVAITIGQSLAGHIGVLTLWFDPSADAVTSQYPPAIAFIAALAVSVLAIRALKGAERQRLIWTVIPLALLCLPNPFYYLPPTLAYSSIQLFFDAVSTLTLLAPVVLTYAALSRRLFDIGFVLNRAAAYGITSTIVVGAFVLVEWAASEWLVNASHSTSVVIGAGVALALGLSMRYIHSYVDAFVDRIFFRKRHENEAALRDFAHEAAFITNRSVLLDRALQEIRDHTDADDASILLLDGSAAYDENDPALVAMRAWHKPIDLHTQPNSALKGELAFPMVSRGQLVGVLICGPKRDGESYAPDEYEALRALAHGVGTSLDTLSDRGTASTNAALADIHTAIRALPDAIAARVRQG